MSNQEENTHEGLGIGVGIAIVGAMLLLVPLLISVSGGWLVGLYAAAVLVAFVGITGVLFELAKLRNRPEIQDIGVGALFFGIAGALLIIRLLSGWPYWATLILVIMILLAMVMAVVGTCMGVFKAIGNQDASVPASGTRPSRQSQALNQQDKLNHRDYAMLGVTLFCGVLTAAVTLIAAFITGN